MLNVHSPKLTLDSNLNRNLIVDQFSLELNFAFKKERTEKVLKEVRFELLNTIKAKKATLDFDAPFFKSLIEIATIYKEFVWVASVKNKIM